MSASNESSMLEILRNAEHFAPRWGVTVMALMAELQACDHDDGGLEILNYIDSELIFLREEWGLEFEPSAFWKTDLSGCGSFADRLGNDAHGSVLEEVEEFLYSARGLYDFLYQRSTQLQTETARPTSTRIAR